ncbi:MAG TPA: serine--tRNA ligase [Terriglobales bacterium]|nr:serine--tRNA ligase [Terriglobales bacterium]
MLELSYVRDHLAEVETMLADRGAKVDLTRFRELDQRRRALILQGDQLKQERNLASEEVARRKRGPERDAPETAALIAQNRALGEKITALDAESKAIESEFEPILLSLPNRPSPATPVGRSADDNQEVRRWGQARTFDFTPQPHWDLGAKLGILDLDAAARISGARFAVYRGAGARLERALANFMLDRHTAAHGYTEVLPPSLVNSQSLRGTGQLPKFAADLFKCEGADLWLIPTAEVPLTNLYADQVLDEAALPVCVVGYTPCFRSEAGAYGRDVRGIMRQHQFQKVELVKIAHPEQSAADHEKLTRDAEAILQELELPYRVMNLCTGDLGFSASQTYDLEVWLPSQNAFREISSCSNFSDFQARRANIRFRRQGRNKTELAHTINGSGLAIGRTWIAVVENYQQADGSVVIPEALRPYMGGLERIQ